MNKSKDPSNECLHQITDIYITIELLSMGSNSTKPSTTTTTSAATPIMAEEKHAGDWERKLLLASFSNGDLLRETERRCMSPLPLHHHIYYHIHAYVTLPMGHVCIIPMVMHAMSHKYPLMSSTR